MSGNTGLLLCDVGEHRFAFRSRDVWHVERAEHLRRDSGADGRVGTLRLGSVAVEVFSLGAVLGVTPDRAPGSDGHVAVTGNSHGLFGWLADRIGRADHAAAAHVAPLPPLIGSPANQWFEGAARIDDQQSALLLRPQCINPLYPEAAPACTGVSPAQPIAAPGRTAEAVAVIFKTAALPPSAAIRYALSGRQIVAIIQAGPRLAIAGCADHVCGLTWWRHAIVPVIDFNPRGAHAERHERLLIARCGARHRGALVALPIAPEVLMCRPDRNCREISGVERPWFAPGVFDVHGEPVALLDLDALLGPDGSGARHGDAVLPDLLVERAARDAEPVGGPLDAPAFGA
jgi:chemotaxis signal transduction protein